MFRPLTGLAAFVAVSACAVPPPATGGDLCGASQMQALVGQHRSRIPPQPAGENWRVTCTDCPVTQDYRPDRLNIFFDQETGIIEEVRCG
jgi:hypothetical protein